VRDEAQKSCRSTFTPHPQRLARPEQELRAFAKVDLAAGEEREVALKAAGAGFRQLRSKTSERDAWRTDPGAYEIRAASSSRDIRLRATVTVPAK